jgi:thiol-disulfide isomerase/thioredoxin
MTSAVPPRPSSERAPTLGTRERVSHALGFARRYAPYALVVGALLYFLRPAPSGPAAGGAAQDFTLPVLAGGEGPTFSLSEHNGKPVLIEVFASWCGACRRMSGTLEEVSAAKRSREVAFVGVSVDDDADAARDAAASWPIRYPVLHANREFSQAYSITALPTFILVDANGNVSEVATGMVRRGTLENWLEGAGAEAVH